MKSEARKQTGETLLDYMQALGRGGIELVMTDPGTLEEVLWRGGVVIPGTSTLGEELGSLIHNRIFACLSGNCGLQEITLETERVRKE